MIVKSVVLALCAGAVYQALKGTGSPSAKLGMCCLISCTVILALI
ncbi:hypothetical protein SAMN02745866_01452 [Alteromonadaceae bacterium Bs31]|nr:hypothetical protein SAMN02745866_01452 [Alteromonadaceae bacterium Bs31]